MSQDPSPEPRNILPDCIIPALALGFTVYYLTTITEVPWISQASAIVVSCLLTLAIIAFVVRSLLRIRRHEETLRFRGAFQELFGFVPVSYYRFGLLLLTVAYVAIIESLGFTLTTFAFVFGAIVLLSSLDNWKRAAIVAAASSVIGYVVFLYIFETRFPRGPLEEWLRTLW